MKRWIAFPAALLVAVPRARADAPPAAQVEMHVDPCAPVDADDARRIVAIELRAHVTDPATTGPATTRVVVACVDRLVELRVTDPLTGKSLSRRVALAEQPTKSRSRLLALAIAELVAASWTELETNPEPAVAPVAPPAPVEEKEAARRSVLARVPAPLRVERPRLPPPPDRVDDHGLHVGAVVGTRWFMVGSDPLLGLGARATFDLEGGPELALDALGEAGRVSSTLGTIALQSWTVGATMSARHAEGRLTLHAGGGLRLGVAHFSGDPSSAAAAEGKSFTAPWGGPMLVGGGVFDLGRRFAITIDAELGYAVLPVRALAGGGPDARVEGAFLGATVGGAVRF